MMLGDALVVARAKFTSSLATGLTTIDALENKAAKTMQRG